MRGICFQRWKIDNIFLLRLDVDFDMNCFPKYHESGFFKWFYVATL